MASIATIAAAPRAVLIERAAALARARWQVEMLFKLRKQHGALAASRGAKPERVLGEVSAELIALVIQHWAPPRGRWQAPDRGLVKAARTGRGYATLLAASLTRPARPLEALDRLTATLAAGCKQQRRRAAPGRLTTPARRHRGGLR